MLLSIKKQRILLCVLLSLFVTALYSARHVSSYPFIAGDTFWNFCDFVIDEEVHFEPSKVKKANTIFVQAHLFEKFFTQYHPRIQAPYIIINANCGTHADDPVPGKYRHYLEDEKILAWFSQNIDCKHPKLHPIPIGLANQGWEHGNIQIFEHCITKKNTYSRDKMLYMNFALGTSPQERPHVYNIFSKKPFCTISKPKGLKLYLEDLATHKFNLSPRGNGLDCHRTWETLLMGCIPIVKSSLLDPLYENLPVIIVKDWNEVTQEFLEKKYTELQSGNYKFEKLYAQYWFDQIRNCQKNALSE